MADEGIRSEQRDSQQLMERRVNAFRIGLDLQGLELDPERSARQQEVFLARGLDHLGRDHLGRRVYVQREAYQRARSASVEAFRVSIRDTYRSDDESPERDMSQPGRWDRRHAPAEQNHHSESEDAPAEQNGLEHSPAPRRGRSRSLDRSRSRERSRSPRVFRSRSPSQQQDGNYASTQRARRSRHAASPSPLTLAAAPDALNGEPSASPEPQNRRRSSHIRQNGLSQ